MTKSVYVAQMETESLNWLSVGETKEETKEAVLKRWNKHIKGQCERFGRSFTKWDLQALEGYYPITVERIILGQCLVQ